MKHLNVYLLFACSFALVLWPGNLWIAWVGFGCAALVWLHGVLEELRRP